MDLLSAVFRAVHFESAGYRWLEMRAPWRIDFDRPELRGVHIIAEGTCVLEFPDGTTETLSQGDLVILPRGDTHALRSPDARRARGIPERQVADNPDTHTNPAPDTVVVCGAFLIGEPDHPALRGLPRTIRVGAENGSPASWLAPLIEAIKTEAHDGGPGSDLVMARLSDAMLLRAIRDSTMDHLRDPALAPALEAMHTDLTRQWTLRDLAAVAGLSRAAFAERFSTRVGVPPMTYLQSLRLQRAKALLAEGRTVAAAAHAVGYQTEAGFAAAFKRSTGVPPGTYRNAKRKSRAA